MIGMTRAAEPALGDRASPDGGAPGREHRLYVGTYTHDGPSRGIHHLIVERASGALRTGGLAAEAANPSFLARAADGRTLVAASEITDYQGEPTGAVLTFARDPRSGALAPRSAQPSGGGAPCHLSLDRGGRHVLVANYVGGSVAALPIAADGTLSPPRSVVRHAGRGAHPTRQTAPHAHCIRVDPAGRFVLVADLGIDQLRVYRLDPATGALVDCGESASLSPGAGPRHLAFSADGRTVYVVNELDSTLAAFAYDPAVGALRVRQTLSTRPAGATGDNFAGDLHVHPSGRTVYASNRGDDTLAVFAIAADGTLALAQTIATGGRWPRSFALDAEGRLLLVANQRSDSVVAFHVDVATGRLTATGSSVTIPSPVHLLFAD